METVPWNREFTVVDGNYRAFRIGDLCMVIAKRATEWYVASFREQVMPFPDEGLRTDLETRDLKWQRWEASQKDNVCLIRPSLPPLPVISRPAVPVTLPPGAKARFFIAVPAFVELVAKCDEEMLVLLTSPMKKITYTWRGVDTPSGESKAEGEICVSLRMKAYRDYIPEKFDPGVIVSTIEVSNHRTKPLPFSRIRLDTDYLSLFLTDVHAWANSCRVNTYDDTNKNSIVYAAAPPDVAGESTLIASPRLTHNRKVKKSGAIDMFVDGFKLHI